MPAGFLRHTARPQSVRPCCSRSPSPPQRPRAQLSLPSPALTSRTARSGGGGAGALASAHLEPPLVPSLDFRHAPTLADLGTCLGKEWGGELRGLQRTATGVQNKESRVPGERVKAKGVQVLGLSSISKGGQKKLCGSLSHHVHKVAGVGMNEGCEAVGCAPVPGSECSWEARALGTFK